jgi:small GTP-binding protein
MSHPQHQKRMRLQCLVLGAEAAGKTALLRRYFNQTFDNNRTPTIGSDFYTGRVSFSFKNDDYSAEDVHVNLQMWDTPGRERFTLKRQPRKYSAVLSPDFFRHADAIMLVYDMTSSTSFTQLLKWYSDLLEFQKRGLEDGKCPRRPVPIFIVANKLDLFQTNSDRLSPIHLRLRTVTQRDVMGLSGSFRGKDFRYEYQVSPPISDSAASTRKGSDDKSTEVSSFLADRENWTNDWSYLDSLLNSEDLSHPDREMVLLWCMRNGLKHYETSAATGEGVTEAVEAILLLALASKDEEIKQQQRQQDLSGPDVLDLHERYAPNESDCCSIFRPLLQVFRRQ